MEFRRFAHSAALGGFGLELDSLVKDVITFIILGKEEAPALPAREIPTGQGWQEESEIKRLNPQIWRGCSLRAKHKGLHPH